MVQDKSLETRKKAFRRIDAHVHVRSDHPDSIALYDKLNIKLLNNCFVDEPGSLWRTQGEAPLIKYKQLTERYPEQYAWITSFDLPGFDDPDYADRVIAHLDEDFAAGSVGCKVWKNIGMEIKKPSGEFVMIDDPVFEPIFTHLEKIGRPLLMHIADPVVGWLPLDEKNVHYEYFSNYPEFHFYNKPGYPTHKQLMTARDSVVARYPNLLMIGAHLGSLAHDVDLVAKRLDQFPNFMVDVSARVIDLAVQDRDKVRQFFGKYSDRILFGTDQVDFQTHCSIAPDERREILDKIQKGYEDYFNYFATDDQMVVNGRDAQGIALPDTILQKFYTGNARRCYPGV